MQNSQQGSVLIGAISYGKLSFSDQQEKNNPEKHPASCRISYVVPPNKVSVCLIKLPPLVSLLFSRFQQAPACSVLWLNLLSCLPWLMSNFNFLLPKGWWGQGKRFFHIYQKDRFWTYKRRGILAIILVCFTFG